MQLSRRAASTATAVAADAGANVVNAAVVDAAVVGTFDTVDTDAPATTHFCAAAQPSFGGRQTRQASPSIKAVQVRSLVSLASDAARLRSQTNRAGSRFPSILFALF